MLPPRVDPLTFMRDKQILGYEPLLGMRCFIKVAYGMKLDSEERDFLAQEHLFGPIAEEPKGGWKKEGYIENFLCCGRRSTKTWIVAYLAIYEAATRNWRDYGFVDENELAYVTIIAQRIEAADEIAKQNIIVALQESPRLSELVVEKFGHSEDEVIARAEKRKIKFGSTMRRIILKNGMAIVSRPCNASGTRGYPSPVAILDELWHWNRDTSTQSMDRSVYRALRPSMAQFGEYRKLFITTSPGGMNGLAWEMFEKRKDYLASGIQFTMHAPTRKMNETIPQSELDDLQMRDPIGFLREYEAHILDDSLSFIDPIAIDACFNQDAYLSVPDEKRFTLMTIDPAFKSDTFSIIVGHFDAESKTIFIDYVDGLEPKKESGYARNLYQQPLRSDDLSKRHFEGGDTKKLNSAKQPVIPEVAIGKLAIIYQMWHCDEVWTDQMSSSMLLPALKKEGMNAHAMHFSGEERRKIYSNLKVIVEHHRLRVAGRGLKWVERLRNEMKCLKLTQTPTGALTITKGGGQGDDFTDACAHLVYRLFRRYKIQFGAGVSGFAAFAAQRTAGMAVAAEDSTPLSAGLPMGMTSFGADLFVPGSN